jgi:hypothetical protein
MPVDESNAPRRFVFERDSFAFANELLWEYHLDPASGKMKFQPRRPKPDYSHRCFVMVRAARQFLYHARFDPQAAMADDATYHNLMRKVIARDPRRPASPQDQIVIPGFGHLREFSAARPQIIKKEAGGAWQSYFLRSHWRMVFPISREHQHRTAARLEESLRRGFSPVIHLVKFPALTINHGMMLFDVSSNNSKCEFSAYDPNDPQRPTVISFEKASGQFSMPVNNYFAGGNLDIIQIFESWFL